jgi:hypothetical protein
MARALAAFAAVAAGCGLVRTPLVEGLDAAVPDAPGLDAPRPDTPALDTPRADVSRQDTPEPPDVPVPPADTRADTPLTPLDVPVTRVDCDMLFGTLRGYVDCGSTDRMLCRFYADPNGSGGTGNCDELCRTASAACERAENNASTCEPTIESIACDDDLDDLICTCRPPA